MNNKDKEFLLDMVNHINNCYRKYYYEMTVRGLPLEVNSFARGLKKALFHIIENDITIKSVDDISPTKIKDRLYKTDGNPLYRDSVGTEGLKGE